MRGMNVCVLLTPVKCYPPFSLLAFELENLLVNDKIKALRETHVCQALYQKLKARKMNSGKLSCIPFQSSSCLSIGAFFCICTTI